MCCCAGLLVARAASCGAPALTSDQQQQVITALLQQLQRHTSSTGSGSSNGNYGVPASSGSTSRSTLAGGAALALGFIGLTGSVEIPGLLDASSSSNSPEVANEDKKAGSSSSSVLSTLLGLAGSKDSRAALRAVTAVGYLTAGSSNIEVHLEAAKGESYITLTREVHCHLEQHGQGDEGTGPS